MDIYLHSSMVRLEIREVDIRGSWYVAFTFQYG